MSLYGDYIKERLGKFILEEEGGFATFFYTEHQTHGTVVYIEDIYVVPEMRRSGLASKMADKVARMALDRSVRKMIGSVCPSAKGSTESLKTLLGYGMKLDGMNDNLIFFIKDLEG